jgi:hypothetical protein
MHPWSAWSFEVLTWLQNSSCVRQWKWNWTKQKCSLANWHGAKVKGTGSFLDSKTESKTHFGSMGRGGCERNCFGPCPYSAVLKVCFLWVALITVPYSDKVSLSTTDQGHLWLFQSQNIPRQPQNFNKINNVRKVKVKEPLGLSCPQRKMVWSNAFRVGNWTWTLKKTNHHFFTQRGKTSLKPSPFAYSVHWSYP